MTDPRDTTSQRATLRDVARLAGVSIPTVSRVVNKSGTVARERRHAVERALEALAYIPNHAARSLISNASRTIGIIVPTIENPLFSPNIEAVERALSAQGYALLIACDQRDPERELQQCRVMIERGVDGLILTGSHRDDRLFALLRQRRVPFVCQDVSRRMQVAGGLSLANETAMALAIDALHSAGHRDIAVLTGPTHHTPPIADRVAGALARMRALGLVAADDVVVEVEDWGSLAAQRGAACLFARTPRPTAVACTGDILSLGLMIAARQAGLSIPRDLSIVGCGQTNMVQFASPALATVSLPFAGMGTLVAERLLGLIATGIAPPWEELPCAFVPGETIAPPRR